MWLLLLKSKTDGAAQNVKIMQETLALLVQPNNLALSGVHITAPLSKLLTTVGRQLGRKWYTGLSFKFSTEMIQCRS